MIRRNDRVTQSNQLVQSAHTLTLNEKRLILCATALIDSSKSHPGLVKVTADYFCSTFGVNPKNAYTMLEDASNRLFERDIKLYSKSELVERFRWIYHIKYQKRQGSVEIGFSPTVMAHLTLIRDKFTSYQLRQIGQLNSFYSLRLYELMAQFLSLKGRSIPLPHLRQMLDLGEKYLDVKNLRVRVLDPAIKEINAHTDLKIDMQPYRKGRKVIGFHFEIERNRQIPLHI